MRFSTVLALTLATASAAPAFASFAEFDARDVDAELFSRAWLDSNGKVHYAPGVKPEHGHRGTGLGQAPPTGFGSRPAGSTSGAKKTEPRRGSKSSSPNKKVRELEIEELFSRAYIGSDGKVHYAPGVRGGAHGSGSRPKGTGSRPRDLDGVEELFSRAYIGSDGKVHYAPGVRGGAHGSGSRPKGTGSRPRELQEREIFYDSLDLD